MHVMRFVKRKTKEAVRAMPNLLALHAWEKVVDDVSKEDEAWHGAKAAAFSNIEYKGGQRAAVTALLCREASNVCRRKPPKVPKSRAPEPAFTELSAEAKSERDVLKMLKNMEAEGMPGMSMYSRDALAEKYCSSDCTGSTAMMTVTMTTQISASATTRASLDGA